MKLLMTLNRYLLFVLMFLGAWGYDVYAQNTMSDEQVMKFVIKENENGTSQQQIVTKLMQRGVTIEQIRRIKSKYDKQKDGSVMGAKDITGAAEDRMRVNNGGKKQQNRRDLQKKDLRKKKDLTEYQKRLQREDDELEFYDEISFMMPDSTDWFDKEESEDESVRKIFGHDIFNNEKLTFEPVMNIATPKDYRLGPGDAVFVDVWGASQKTYSVTVSPEGKIDIEEFGPVSVSGLTVDEANRRLRATLGQRYKNSRVELTVGQTRTISVNVMGEVKNPGTYTLSAFATVFHALYMAGGPNDIGTLRDIKVYRDNRLVTAVDVYDYILNGKLEGNVRLADNDVIVVGPYDCLVNIVGKVKRPMFYEMKNTESVATLLKYAGGFTGDAYEKNLRLIRKNGTEYSVYTITEFDRSTFKVQDGDSLTVDSVLPRFKNMVEVKGAVFRPGKYQIGSSISTVRQLVQSAEGLTEDAFTARAVMHRRKADRSLEVLALDVDKIMKQEVPDVPLRNEDVLYIPSMEDLQNELTLTIYGEVLYPGVYQYAENTSLEDLVLQAGGLKDAASVVKVDVSRRIRNRKAIQAGGVVAQNYSFALKDGFVVEGTPGFVLEPFDEVYIRKSPGYIEQEHVAVEGEVTFTGTYALSKKGQRLSDLVKNAGGLTKEAYAKGARLERRLTEAEKLKQQSMLKLINSGDSVDVRKIDLGDTRYVGINLDMALANPGSDEWDIVLEEGDRLIVPQFNNTVSVNGEVMYPNTIAFKSGEKLDYYINQAGGYSMRAKKSRVFAVHMNGTVTRVKSAKDIQPGCEIVVPSKPRRRGLSLPEILSMGSTTASLGAVLVSLLK